MKRLKSFLLAILLLVCLCPVSAEAASASLSTGSIASVGSDVTLTFKAGGTNIMGVEATLEYDEEVLEYRSYRCMLSGWDVVRNDSTLTMYGVSNPISAPTAIMAITFRVKNDLHVGTELNVSLKDIVISDGSADSSIGAVTWRGTVAGAVSTPTSIAYIEGRPSVQYESLQDAIDAAKNGDVIKMLGDFMLYNETLAIDERSSAYSKVLKDISFDLCGHKFDLKGGVIDGSFTFENGTVNVSDDSCRIDGNLAAKNAVVNIKGGTITGLLNIESDVNCGIWAGSFPGARHADVAPYLVSETPFYSIEVTQRPSVEGADWPIEVPPMSWLSVDVFGGSSVMTHDGCFVECKPGVTASFVCDPGPKGEYYECHIGSAGWSGLANGDNLVTVSKKDGSVTYTMCPADTYTGVLGGKGRVSVVFSAVPYNITKGITTNGSIIVADSAVPDACVKFTTVPDDGYEVESLSIVKTSDGTDISDSVFFVGSPNTYSFSMPWEDITINVIFTKLDSSDEGETPSIRPSYPIVSPSTTITSVDVDNSSLSSAALAVGNAIATGDADLVPAAGYTKEEIINLQKNSKLEMSIEKKTAYNTADKMLIDAAIAKAGGAVSGTPIQYFDFTVVLKHEDTGTVVATVSNTKTPITIMVDLSAELQKAAKDGKHIAVVCCHDGTTTFLDTKLNASKSQITFASAEFSTYAVVAVDGIESPKTSDAGVALYAGMSILSATSGAWMIGKLRKSI